MISTKDGVRFHDPILDALQLASESLGIDLVITCGQEGHPLTDPHTEGRAYDVRSRDLTDKSGVLFAIMRAFNDGPLAGKDGGLVTDHYFGWLENAGQADEHFHVQVRRGASSTPTI